MKRALILITTSAFLLGGCGGAAAVEALGKLADKACECKGDAECEKALVADVDKWVEEHGQARGGDQKKAEEHTAKLAGCSPKAAAALVAAAAKQQ